MVGGTPSRFLGITIYLLGLVGLFRFAKKLKDKIKGKIFFGLGLVWAGSLPLFYIFIKNPSEYYFNYLLVPALMLTAYLLKSLRRFGIAVLAGLIIYFSWKAWPLLRSVNLSLKEKDHAVSVLSKITKDTQPFDVSFDVPLGEDTGFRYLLNYHKVSVSGSPADPLIEFVIPHEKKPGAFVVGTIGIYMPNGWLKNNWLKLPK